MRACNSEGLSFWCSAAPLHGVHVMESASELVSDCVSRAKEAAAQGVLLRAPFETLFEYLQAGPSPLEHPAYWLSKSIFYCLHAISP